MIQLRPYQVENAALACDIVKRLGIAYLAMEVRTGKTFTVLEAARLYGARKVIFITRKKAISSIEKDYRALNPGYDLTVINDQSLHKVTDNDFDFAVYDEAHRLGGFPKPSLGAKTIKSRFGHLPIVLLSGTPTPESWSQIYHQFWVSKRSPFRHANFYLWAREFVRVYERQLAYGTIRFYERAIEDKIEQVVSPYMIRFSQADAGFVCQIHEHFCRVPMPVELLEIGRAIVEDSVFEFDDGIIIADGPAAIMQKVHQIHSGTVLLSENAAQKRETRILSLAKAQFIRDNWPGGKLVIFYVYKTELLALKEVLGDRLTTDLDEFQSDPSKSCAYQIVAGREGLNLSLGECIIFYNISYSATSYWQGRDRLTTSTRTTSDIYWLFSDFDGKSGIEEEIYNVVMQKKRYTTNHFLKGKYA